MSVYDLLRNDIKILDKYEVSGVPHVLVCIPNTLLPYIRGKYTLGRWIVIDKYKDNPLIPYKQFKLCRVLNGGKK